MSRTVTATWAEQAQETLNALLAIDRQQRRRPDLLFAPGVNDAQIRRAQDRLGVVLPDDLVALYRLVNGGLCWQPGTWLPLQEMVLRHDAMGFQALMRGLPDAPEAADAHALLRQGAWHPAWLPLAQHQIRGQRNWLCLDTAPAAHGLPCPLLEVPDVSYDGALAPDPQVRWVAPSVMSYLQGVAECVKHHRQHALTRAVLKGPYDQRPGWAWVREVLGSLGTVPPAPPAAIAPWPPTTARPEAELAEALQALRQTPAPRSEHVGLAEQVRLYDVRWLETRAISVSHWGFGHREKPSVMGRVLHAWARGGLSPRVLLLLPSNLHQSHLAQALCAQRHRREGQQPQAYLCIDARHHLEALFQDDSPIQSLASLLAAEAQRRQVPQHHATAWMDALRQGLLKLIVVHSEMLWLAHGESVRWGADLDAETESRGQLLFMVAQEALDEPTAANHMAHLLSDWTLAGPTQTTVLCCDTAGLYGEDYAVSQALAAYGLAGDAQAEVCWLAKQASQPSDEPVRDFPVVWLEHLLQGLPCALHPKLKKLMAAVKKALVERASSPHGDHDVPGVAMKRVAQGVARWPASEQRLGRFIARRWLGLQVGDDHGSYNGEPWWCTDPVPALLAAMAADDDAGVCEVLNGSIEISHIQDEIPSAWMALGHHTPYTGTARLLSQRHSPRLTGRLLALASAMWTVGMPSGADCVTQARAQQALTLPQPPLTAQLAGADLRRVSLYAWVLPGVDLSGALVEYALFHQMDLSRANLSGLTGSSCSFYHCDLRGATLDGAQLPESSFSHSDLRNISADGLNAPNSDWSNARWDQLLGPRVSGARSTYPGVSPQTHSAPVSPQALTQWPQTAPRLLRACPQGRHLMLAFADGELLAVDPETLQIRWGWCLPDGPTEEIWMHEVADLCISLHGAKAQPLLWNTQTGRNFHRLTQMALASRSFASVGIECPSWTSIGPMKRHPGWLFTIGQQTKAIELVDADRPSSCGTNPSSVPGPGTLRCFASWANHDLVAWSTTDRIEITPLNSPTGEATKVAWAPPSAEALHALDFQGSLILLVLDEHGLCWGDIAAPQALGRLAWADLPEAARHARRHLSAHSPLLLLEGPDLVPLLLDLLSGRVRRLAEDLAAGTPATLLPDGAVVWAAEGLRRLRV